MECVLALDSILRIHVSSHGDDGESFWGVLIIPQEGMLLGFYVKPVTREVRLKQGEVMGEENTAGECLTFVHKRLDLF